MSPYISWLNAWESAAFGPNSFYGEFGKGGSNPYNHFDTAVKSDPHLAAKLFPYLQKAYVKSGSPSHFLILDAGGSDGSLINELKTLISQNKLNWKTQIFDVSSGDVRKIPIREQFGVVIAHELLDDIPLSVVEYDEDMTARTVWSILTRATKYWVNQYPKRSQNGCKTGGHRPWHMRDVKLESHEITLGPNSRRFFKQVEP